EAFRLQDRVAAEVAQAYAQAQEATPRVREAESELKDAVFSVSENLKGVQETRRVGNLDILIIRPQEAVAAIQALVNAYADYYGAVADFNRAQFRLYRALGQPAQLLLDGGSVPCPTPSPPGQVDENASGQPRGRLAGQTSVWGNVKGN